MKTPYNNLYICLNNIKNLNNYLKKLFLTIMSNDNISNDKLIQTPEFKNPEQNRFHNIYLDANIIKKNSFVLNIRVNNFKADFYNSNNYQELIIPEEDTTLTVFDIMYKELDISSLKSSPTTQAQSNHVF
jgi:hypothetical protein